MRFSLQEIKKSIHRHGGELSLVLHFLRPGELSTEIERFISYHERLLGQPKRQFSFDDACACIGDYRLAHCLTATLSNWYNWRQCEWAEVVQRCVDGDRHGEREQDEGRYGEGEQGGGKLRPYISENALLSPVLGEQGGGKPRPYISENALLSPVQLRLALYDYVNEHYGGFLDTHMRSVAVQQFAEMMHLRVADLEYLLVLDSEEETILVRSTPEPPSAQEVATLYNQWAFEAALFNSSSVHFVIDYVAFSNASPDVGTQFIASTISTGIGSVIKRLCYLARKLGVYYDLTYEESEIKGERSVVAQKRQASLSNNRPFTFGIDTSIRSIPTHLHLTLYGPQDVTGTPQQYGMRLARLCRMLLGYSVPKTEIGRKKGKRTGLTSAIVEAEATVHFLQRTYTFAMDGNLLSLIEPVGNVEVANQEITASGEIIEGKAITDGRPATGDRPSPGHPDSPPIFDSGIEESFAEAFTALANSQGVDGWRLEREPEPLLLNQSIFIPDFALTRAQQRIYVEILGFWTTSYRERKIQKLQHLSGRNDLLLAIPVEAKDAFASIAPHFPIVIYDGQLSATEVLQVLRSHYDDFTERVAAISIAEVRTLVTKKGLLPERTCYEVLGCYRRSELLRAAERVVNEDILFVPGLGLYHVAAIEQLKYSFLAWMSTVRPLPLREVLSEMKIRWPMLTDCENVPLEALLGLWPEVQIQRSSIFDAVVELTPNTNIGEQSTATASSSMSIVSPPFTEPTKETKKQVREKRVGLKKRSSNEAIQGDLWG